MLITLVEDQIVQEMIDYLKANTPITNFQNGSIAKALVVCVAKQLVKQYKMLDIQSKAAYVSTSGGMYLDMIGELLNCTRYSGEKDENYRYRIAHQVQIIAGQNDTSVRLRCLAIDGVTDVLVKNYARGIGTFDVYVITNDPITSADILSQAQSIINETLTGGISGLALSPVSVPVDLKIKLITSAPLSSTTKNLVKTSVSSYFDSLNLGSTMIIDQVTKAILNSSPLVQQFEYTEVRVNGKLISPSNYPAIFNERLYLRDLVIV